MAGEKLSTSFRIGPERRGTFAVCDLIAIDATEIPAAIPASASHVASQFQATVWREATMRRGDRRDADDDLSPSRERRERPRAFHHAPDEAQVVHRPRLHLGRLGAIRPMGEGGAE